MKKLLIAVVAIALFAAPAFAEGIDDVDFAALMWPTFQRRPDMIENCALKLAHTEPFDTNTEWPAYCNDYRDTDVVQNRVKEIKQGIASIKSSKARAKINAGKIWIGATAKQAELAWGRPKKITRTVTARRSREQWIYDAGMYIFIDNGKVSGWQN